MSAKIKYNLDVFAKASDMVEAGSPWCCNLIGDAARHFGNTNWDCPERDLFEAVYDVHNPIYGGRCTFQGIHRYHYPEEGTLTVSDLIEIRLLALAFVREIARRKNRQGTHTARAKRRAENRAKKELEKVADAEFKKILDKMEKFGEIPVVDLRNCKPGDKLLTKHGIILTYVGTNTDPLYPHEVEYPTGGHGSRTDDGFAFRNSRHSADQDVIKVLGR